MNLDLVQVEKDLSVSLQHLMDLHFKAEDQNKLDKFGGSKLNFFFIKWYVLKSKL